MAANMDTVGTLSMGKSLSSLGAITCLHKHYDEDTLVNVFVKPTDLIWYSTGTSKKDIEKLERVFNTIQKSNGYIPNVCLDVANGYTEQFVKTAAHIRKLFPELVLMAGNVVTQEMVEELIIHGKVDIVKVGIGSGSVCTTRLNRRGISTIECRNGMYGRCSWSWWTHL